MNITVSELAAIIGASSSSLINNGEMPLRNVITDSRSLLFTADTVFFALNGNANNGHNYVTHLYRQGVRCFVTGLDFDTRNFADVNILKVKSPLAALQTLGASQRRLMSAQVIAVTGSRGKTVVKEMLTAMASPEVCVSSSPRSWNSQVGVPLSLCMMNNDCDFAIVEAGISAPAEMSALADIIKPNIGIFTGITDEHRRNFADADQQLSEKLTLFGSCNTVLTVNGYADSIRKRYPDTRVIECDGYANICRKALQVMGIPVSDIICAPAETRIDITDNVNGNVVACDRFTCSYDGIFTALDTVRRRVHGSKNIVAVLGDLVNVCDRRCDDVYTRLGDALFSYGVTEIIALGPELARHAADWKYPIAVNAFDSMDELMNSGATETLYNRCIYINTGDKSLSVELYNRLSNNRNITKLEVNLDSLAHNFNVYRSMLPPTTGLVGMIKASGYGCGSVEVARTLQSIGADMVAVAVVDEGVEIRRNGISLPILVLDPWCDNMNLIFAYNLEPTVIEPSEHMLRQIDEAARNQNIDVARVHLKFDTGMHRVGLSEDEIPGFLDLLKRFPRIKIESVFSHLATADCLDLDDYTEQQIATFTRMSDLVCRSLPYKERRHILNTAGIVRYGRKYTFEMARLGIGLYGLSALPEGFEGSKLRPVASLFTRIITKRRYPAGTCVGYGCKGRLKRDSVIATLPIGYADGIDRRLGCGNAYFLVDGKPCPTVGNICMDLCMIDITDVPEPKSSLVEIFGPNAPIQRLADTLGTITYEILAKVSPRVQRVYYKE